MSDPKILLRACLCPSEGQRAQPTLYTGVSIRKLQLFQRFVQGLVVEEQHLTFLVLRVCDDIDRNGHVRFWSEHYGHHVA